MNANNLPTVMVKCLALSSDDVVYIKERLLALAGTAKTGVWREVVREVLDEPQSLAAAFSAVLDMPKRDREAFAKAFNGLLEELRCDDFFGTEGQCDPRGDGRD